MRRRHLIGDIQECASPELFHIGSGRNIRVSRMGPAADIAVEFAGFSPDARLDSVLQRRVQREALDQGRQKGKPETAFEGTRRGGFRRDLDPGPSHGKRAKEERRSSGQYALGSCIRALGERELIAWPDHGNQRMHLS